MAIGKIGPFDVTKDLWDSYVERLEQYFIANEVKVAMKVATLITVMGSDAYELMVNLCTPDKPSTKSFEDLVKVMKAHLQPKPSLLAERFKFRQRVQKENEIVIDYLTELKRLSKDCKFESASLKENIRDQFVCGLRNENIRQRLFAEEDSITLEKAFRLAVAMETAETNAALVEDRTRAGKSDGLPTTSVNQLRSSERNRARRTSTWHGGMYRGQSDKETGAGASGRSGAGSDKRSAGKNPDTKRCNVCGGQHEATLCKFRYYVCRVCNKEGHLKRMCPKFRGGYSKLHHLSEQRVRSDSEDNDSEEFQIL
nr:uncharacterized protein LOC128674077 [Plodia interpunctella]